MSSEPSNTPSRNHRKNRAQRACPCLQCDFELFPNWAYALKRILITVWTGPCKSKTFVLVSALSSFRAMSFLLLFLVFLIFLSSLQLPLVCQCVAPSYYFSSPLILHFGIFLLPSSVCVCLSLISLVSSLSLSHLSLSLYLSLSLSPLFVRFIYLCLS